MFRWKICVDVPLWMAGILALLWAPAAGASGLRKPHNADLAAAGRTLVWSSEFNGTNGSLPNPAKWKIVSSGSGFGNRELEYYTGRPSNIQIKDGNLVITARRENYTGPGGVTRHYTSARIESKGLFKFKYGLVEARIKLPKGQGVWSAFWMLGSNFDAIGWPKCGEVDIMENIGSEPWKVHGSLHGPGYSGADALTAAFTLPSQSDFSDHYHLFAIEWSPDTIRFYVDHHLYETRTASGLPLDKPWAFDHPFYLVLNVAVGGYWPGDPTAATRFPTSMLVDYVRVYRLGESPAMSPSLHARRNGAQP